MQTKTEVIDLKKAKLYLEKNVDFESGVEGTNRPISATVVNNYAKAMLSGAWLHTHQGIGFDTNDNLKDGQQRLRALVQAAETGE